jgi:type I restriction enzyme, S subunit
MQTTTKTTGKNIPKLRFKEFSGEWETQQLNNAIKTLDAGISVNSVDKPAVNNESGILKTSCVTLGKFDPNQNKLVSDEHEISRLKEKVSENSIIISRMNTPDLVGANAFIDKNYDTLYLPDRLWAAKIKTTHEPRWIGFILSSRKFRSLLSTRATGTSNSMKNISKSDVLTLPLIAPTLPEQQKIATFLTTVDKKIEQLTKKMQLFEQYKKGIMQQLFSQKVRFSVSPSTVEGDRKKFPEWEEKRLGDVFQITRGNVLALNKMKPNKDDKYCYRVYSSQTKNNGLTGYFNEYLYENAITWTTDGANAGDVRYRNGKFYCTNVCGVLISDKGNANQCIAEILNAITKRYVSYVGNPKLMNNTMSAIKIRFPSTEEQQKIALFLTAMHSKIEHINKQIEQATQWKKGLLQQMFV